MVQSDVIMSGVGKCFPRACASFDARFSLSETCDSGFTLRFGWFIMMDEKRRDSGREV